MNKARAWTSNIIVDAGMRAAPVEDPWRVQKGSDDFLDQFLQVYAMALVFGAPEATGRIVRQAQCVADSTREILAHCDIVQLVIRLATTLST